MFITGYLSNFVLISKLYLGSAVLEALVFSHMNLEIGSEQKNKIDT